MCPNDVLRPRVQADIAHRRAISDRHGEQERRNKAHGQIRRNRSAAASLSSRGVRNIPTIAIRWSPLVLHARRRRNSHSAGTRAVAGRRAARRKHSGGWSSVIDRLNQYERGLKAIDDFQTTVRLPGHGRRRLCGVNNFRRTIRLVDQVLHDRFARRGRERFSIFPGPEFSARFESRATAA